MGDKFTHRFPVFLINSEFGGRGLNFRAATSVHGITLLILGTFPDPTARLQTLKRVGRFNDKCTRYWDTTFPMYDEEKMLKYRGGITKALQKILLAKSKACLNGDIPM